MEFRVGLPPTRAGVLRQEFGADIPPEISDAAWVAVHPTQLYETIAGVLIWGVALWLISRLPKPGNVFLPVVALLALERFLVEFVRAKDDRFFGEFTLAQLISVLVLLAAAFFAWRNRGGATPPGSADPKAA
jgi:phosphatidylglycerol:prolipoprotein diacylglycerol transferase